MARGGSNTLLALVLVGGGLWAGLKGYLGKDVQLSLGQMLSQLFPKDKGCGNAIPQGMKQYCQATCNNYIYEQMLTWKALRIANFQNPNDWNAFRTHIAGIKAPHINSDQPFEEFCTNEALKGCGADPSRPERCLAGWPALPTSGGLPWV